MTKELGARSGRLHRGMRPRWWLMVVVLSVGVLSLIWFRATLVEVTNSQRSMDDYRIAMSLATCNGLLDVGVAESSDKVEVTVRDFRKLIPRLSGDDCDDRVIVELQEPLGQRLLIDGATGGTLDAREPWSPEAVEWPYDRSQFTETDYEAALVATVACIEAADPAIDGYVFQDLDWKTYRWEKAPDEHGRVTRSPVIDQCEAIHLMPLH